MASRGLSDDEFQRLQLQLLELRTSNYQLEDKSRRQERDLTAFKSQVKVLNKELEKTTKVLNRSKKAKEVESLVVENEALQRKLANQEDEFRLQNETLMKELAQIVAEKDELEKELKRLRNNSDPLEESEVLRRLQAENSALKKNLTGSRRDLSSTSDSVTLEISNLQDLQLQLVVEQEEKSLLKEQLDSCQKIHCELEEEIRKLQEKFKRKQESFVKLQEEKEQQFIDLNEKFKSLKLKRDEEVGQLEASCKDLNEQVTTLQTKAESVEILQQEVAKNLAEIESLESMKQLLDGQEHKSRGRIDELEDIVIALEDKLDVVKRDESRLQLVDHLQSTVIQLESKCSSLVSELEDVQGQLQVTQASHQASCSELVQVKDQLQQQTAVLQDSQKLADKRKSLLDELAVKYQTVMDQHHINVKTLQERHQQEHQQLTNQLHDYEQTRRSLKQLESTLEEFKVTIKSLESAKGWLERQLKETQQEVETMRTESSEIAKAKENENKLKLEELETKWQHDNNTLQQKLAQQIQEWREKMTQVEKVVAMKEEEIINLRQEANDFIQEKKIYEKKALVTVKDLKRQLQMERKKCEKLQERLQEYLQTTSHISVEELAITVGSKNESGPGDTSSSLCSSGLASALTRDNSLQSPLESEDTQLSPDCEHTDLLLRLADLQRDKWSLEEKVSHLETSNSAMCDDLLGKTAIIQHYIMNSKAGLTPSQTEKMSLKKVLDLVMDKSDEREMNKKLQAILEETLTKNMYLQQDVEHLSLEVVRLSKLVPTAR